MKRPRKGEVGDWGRVRTELSILAWFIACFFVTDKKIGKAYAKARVKIARTELSKL